MRLKKISSKKLAPISAFHSYPAHHFLDIIFPVMDTPIVHCFKKTLTAITFILLLPLMIVIALAIRLSMGAPVLFKQKRIGLNHRPFTLYKFRTMLNLHDSEGKLLTDDERLTRLGRFLRKTSLDELPQLFNVLRGDLGVVGPRPLLTDFLTGFTPEQAKRHQVKPGITGWAQINGRNSISYDEKFKLDIWYVENRTLWLDIKIILKTIPVVLFRKNVAYSDVSDYQKYLAMQDATTPEEDEA